MNDRYISQTYPKSRIGTIDVGRVGLLKHHIVGLIEVDVTDALKKITELKNDRVPVSFTAWLLKCIGDVACNHPLLHGVKKGKRRIIAFKDVDISIVIEKVIDSVPVPIPYIIREVNKKSISRIHDEIESAKVRPIVNEGDYAPGSRHKGFMMNLYYLLPGFIRRILWRIILSSPYLVKNMMGSIVFTSVGMAGSIKGWVIPRSINPLCIAISSISSKPGVLDNRILIREYLPVTILVDHDVIDGAPAVRIVNELVNCIENAYLL